jgi:hypothetical protein
MSLDDLAAGIDDRFAMLTGGPRSAPKRQQTLRNAVDWSFRLLDADEQHVLRHLAAFRGGCDLEAATAVSEPGGSSSTGVLDVLVRLVDKSLVTAVDTRDGSRYHIHELIREHALGSVDEQERAAIRDRQARWCMALASRLRPGPVPGDERRWLRRHDVERDNLRAAVDWLTARDAEAALRLLLDVQPGMDMTAQGRWCLELIESVLPLARDAPPADRADALAQMAWTRSDRRDAHALELCAEAVGLLPEVDDAAAECSVRLAVVKCHGDAADGAIDEAELAAALDAGDRASAFWAIMVRYVLSFRAPPLMAEALSSAALGVAEQSGMDLLAAMVRSNLACIAQFRGESEAALEMWRTLLPMLDDIADTEGDNACYCSLAEGEHGDLAVGLHLAEDYVIRLTSAPHDPHLAAALYAVVAHLRRLSGDLDGAAVALDHVLRSGREDFDFLGGLAIITRSAVLRERGRPDEAAAVIEVASGHARFHGLTDIPMRVVEELAAVALELGRPDASADLLATAGVMRERDGRPLSPAGRHEVDALRARLGDRTGEVLEVGAVVALAHALATETMG